VGIGGAGHGQAAPQVAQAVLGLVGDGLVGRLFRAIGGQTAALDHERGDHPVERGALVLALAHVGQEVVHGPGRGLGVQLHGEPAQAGGELHLRPGRGGGAGRQGGEAEQEGGWTRGMGHGGTPGWHKPPLCPRRAGRVQMRVLASNLAYPYLSPGVPCGATLSHAGLSPVRPAAPRRPAGAVQHAGLHPLRRGAGPDRQPGPGGGAGPARGGPDPAPHRPGLPAAVPADARHPAGDLHPRLRGDPGRAGLALAVSHPAHHGDPGPPGPAGRHRPAAAADPAPAPGRLDRPGLPGAGGDPALGHGGSVPAGGHRLLRQTVPDRHDGAGAGPVRPGRLHRGHGRGGRDPGTPDRLGRQRPRRSRRRPRGPASGWRRTPERAPGRPAGLRHLRPAGAHRRPGALPPLRREPAQPQAGQPGPHLGPAGDLGHPVPARQRPAGDPGAESGQGPRGHHPQRRALLPPHRILAAGPADLRGQRAGAAGQVRGAHLPAAFGALPVPLAAPAAGPAVPPHRSGGPLVHGGHLRHHHHRGPDAHGQHGLGGAAPGRHGLRAHGGGHPAGRAQFRSQAGLGHPGAGACLNFRRKPQTRPACRLTCRLICPVPWCAAGGPPWSG